MLAPFRAATLQALAAPFGYPARDPNRLLRRHGARPDGHSAMEHIMNTITPPPATRPALRTPHRVRTGSSQRLAQALFDRAGPLARLVRHSETQWSSATFAGARHSFALRFEGADAVADAETLAIAVGDADITVRGALVAEITVTRFTQTLLPHPAADIEIAVLLLDDPDSH